MRYSFIILGVLILVMLVILFLQHKKKKKLESILSGTSILPVQDAQVAITTKAINDIISNLNKNAANNPFTLDTLKSVAATNGYLVLGSDETHTMEYNPKRVIVLVTVPNCIMAPCPNIFTIQSVG